MSVDFVGASVVPFPSNMCCKMTTMSATTLERAVPPSPSASQSWQAVLVEFKLFKSLRYQTHLLGSMPQCCARPSTSAIPCAGMILKLRCTMSMLLRLDSQNSSDGFNRHHRSLAVVAAATGTRSSSQNPRSKSSNSWDSTSKQPIFGPSLTTETILHVVWRSDA